MGPQKAFKVAEHAIRYVRWMNRKNPACLTDLTQKPLESSTTTDDEVIQDSSRKSGWLRGSLQRGSALDVNFFSEVTAVLQRGRESAQSLRSPSIAPAEFADTLPTQRFQEPLTPASRSHSVAKSSVHSNGGNSRASCTSPMQNIMTVPNKADMMYSPS